VQRYISPHLVRFDERFLFDGRPIAEPELADVLDMCERTNRGEPITEFEIITAAAFLAFARHPADVVLLETGLGGRLDATNVVARPRLTALSPISLDHQAYLGERIEQIAFEKAGILKPGVPCIVGPQPPEVLAVVEQRARALGAPLGVHGRDWLARQEGDRLAVTIGDATYDLPLPALAGRHQIENAGLAVACALALGHLAPDARAVAEGLRTVEWPGRLQRLTKGPLLERLPRGCELWLDGGHNPAAGEALAASLNGALAHPLHLVVGMLNTKDEAGFLRPLAPLARSLHTVPVPGEAASRDPIEAAALARRLGIAATAASDVTSALGAIGATDPKAARVLVCGSLYLAGHVLRENA
jgi:dihydrofolate synthase/folylpolyglutamate synthase